MTINIKKIKVLIFKKGGKNKKRESWKYNDVQSEIMKEYKYLAVWFSTGSTSEKHIKKNTEQIIKGINGTWGIFKRARINNLRRRLFLMQSIAKNAVWRRNMGMAQ